uniref:Uncharacterized protein n=1 Tax=Candidatus Kentrum sp. LPFa TaxID=2126335 RepID=A0A450X2K1_9GAMM|nr:MAG: hypothetical protein BECKLPF1236B_GA0070989_13623 [Candidatus Kentron sp. LPFa]
MGEKIRAKVAKVLNSREIVITAGSTEGVVIGMYFDVMDRKGEDIIDPDTSELLGSVERPKVRVRIMHVQERIALATTFKTQKINIGGRGTEIGAVLGVFSQALMPPRYVTKYETLKTDEKTWEDVEEKQRHVKIGDPVVQVIEEVGALREALDQRTAPSNRTTSLATP